MENLREKMQTFMKARPHTDFQSEILNVVAVPLYLYTISGVLYYSAFFVMPYHFGITDSHDKDWTLFFQKGLLLIVYVQMMWNWLCIRLVDGSSLKTATNAECFVSNSRNYQRVQNDFDNVVVNGLNQKSCARTEISGTQEAVRPARVSYWSWKYCDKCGLNAPPRCHHCPFCKNCILKRDHHCFFARRCIGFYNQRHFIVFLVWAVFGTSYTTLYFLPYFFKIVWIQMSFWDIFPPFALLRAAAGHCSFWAANMITTFTLNFLFVVLSINFAVEQLQLIRSGMTQFEQYKVDKNRLVISDPRPFKEKLRSVFGCDYGLSLICPCAHLIFPPQEDPFEWPRHKIYRK